MIPATSTTNNDNNNNENLQMSQSQEIEANVQHTVLNNAVAEFLQDMNGWDHINDCTQAVVSNIIGERNYHSHNNNNNINNSNSRFDIAGQDELTPFRILRSQVQLGNDLGIDNSVSTFALDLVSPPTLLPGVSLIPSIIMAPNMCISSPQTYLMPSYLQANYGSLQMPQEILAPVVPSQASSSSVQLQYSDPSASWTVSSSPLLPTPDLPLLQQTPHTEYLNMPSQMHQYQDPTAQVPLSTSYPPSNSTTKISADVVPVMNPLLEPQYLYNNDNPNLLDYLTITTTAATTTTTTTTASSGAVNSLPNEPVVVSPAPDIKHLFPPSLCSSFPQLSLSPSLPPTSPWSPSLPPSSSSCLQPQPTVTAVAAAAATATTTAATATATAATTTKTTKIAEISCSANSKSIITTQNPTRPTPYPVRFYIMEPYQHSTTKVDRRSFNSCKELKQAKAKALESQDQIYRKC
ncbi:hypothetical protein BGX20_009729 [Mortierella sp. AD010]|nr:hypothetical protein BGX20_009729 [Mortierella sp. AD010]